MPKNSSSKKMSLDAIGRDLLPSEVEAEKAVVAKYGPGGNLPTRAEVLAEQCRVIAEGLAKSGAAPDDAQLPMLPLSAFHQAQPEANWASTQPAHVVPLREGERFIVQLEESPMLRGYGPWRSEKLAEQGIAACEQDAKSVSQGLLSAINDRLSDYELEHVITAFAAELARRQAER